MKPPKKIKKIHETRSQKKKMRGLLLKPGVFGVVLVTKTKTPSFNEYHHSFSCSYLQKHVNTAIFRPSFTGYRAKKNMSVFHLKPSFSHLRPNFGHEYHHYIIILWMMLN